MKETILTKHINIITAVLVGMTLLAGAVQSGALFGDVNAATRTRLEATATVAVSAACSLTGEVTSEHTATLVPGVYSGAYETDGLTPYANGIGSTTLTAICNDNGGFAIYAVGGSLKEGTIGATNLVGAGTGQTIATGTATSGNTSNWAMKLAKVTNSYLPDNLTIVNNFDSFHTIPDNYTRVARYDSATDNNQGSQMTTTYAAYIQPAQAADVYVGHVTYALVHPSTSVALESYIMQEIADWKGELLPGVEVTAVDNRDGKYYTVALMDDDSIWMTQNLDLQIGGTYNGDPIVLTSENTDLTAYQTTGGVKFTDYSYNNGLITWAPTVANTNATVTGTPAYITTDGGTTVAGWADDSNKPYMMEGGDTYSVQGTRFNSLSDCEANGTRTEAECMHYHVGNYYNFSAVVAMSDTSSYTADKTVMPNSICPAGWRLPNGLTSDGTNVVQSDFNKLLTEYGIANGTDLTGGNVGWQTNGFTNIGLAPLFFVRSGYVGGATLFNFNSLSNYRSSTVGSAAYGYILYYDSSVLYPAHRDGRNYGRSVRCIAR